MRLAQLMSMLFGLALVCTACTSSTGATDGNDPGTEPIASLGATTSTPVQRQAFATEVVVTSPDGLLRIELGIDELERASYRVVRTIAGIDEQVLTDSTLGLETSVGSFARPGQLNAIGTTQAERVSFELPHGKARVIDVESQTLSIQLGEATRGLVLDVSVSNTWVAFRYRLDASGETISVEWERSSFAVPDTNRAWLQRHDPPGLYTPAYERLRSREATAGNPGRSDYGWTFPALFASADSWTLITEAALGDGQAGSHFSPAATDGEFLLNFANWGEGNGVGAPQPTADDTWVSPWRVVLNSTDVGDIVESDAVRALSEPSAGQDQVDYRWVQPGRVSWSWWSDHDSSKDGDAMEPFIDLAQELGWEYSLVDANWNTMTDERVQELIDYAAAREVGLWFWYNSGGENNAVTEAPRDLMADPETRRAEMARIAALGIRGVKVDFFHSDKPATIQLYRDILRDAADAQLMVNFHGSTVPRGWSVEFPHLMTMEAVRGAEIYTFDANYQRVAARQNTTLPFTRNVVGSMDYTPVILGDSYLRMTTNSHELALAVVFESALLHLVDTPQAYLNQPPEIIDLLATVPTVWDETQFIAGEPESHVVIARRLGDDWWLGAISALDELTTVPVDLASLGIAPGTPMVLVCDDPIWEPNDDTDDGNEYADPAQYAITDDESPEDLRLRLVPSGGCIARFSPTP